MADGYLIITFQLRILILMVAGRSSAKLKNSTSDLSPTAGQMTRLLGLAQASKLFRNDKD